jgi:hypothetical protein
MEGSVEIEGLVSAARIEAKRGQITIANAENSIIIGKKVRITGRATNCDVIAEEAEIETFEDSRIVAKKVSLGSAGDRKGRDDDHKTTVFLELPAPLEEDA